MKLSELYKQPLEEVVKTMEISKLQVHTDDHNNVKAIELKFVEKEIQSKVSESDSFFHIKKCTK